MGKFIYLQNPLESKIDLDTPLINNIIPRECTDIEFWAISSSFNHFAKYNSTTEFGISFIVADIEDEYDQNIGDALMLSDLEVYVTFCGIIFPYKDVLLYDPVIQKELGSFTHAKARFGSPKQIRHSNLAGDFSYKANIKPMHSNVLFEQFSGFHSDHIERLKVVKLDVKLNPNTLYNSLIKYHKAPIENITNSIRDYENLALIPYSSPLKILGFVAILERLITDDSRHNVIPISKQFASKLILINNRLEKHQLQFNMWFNPSTPDKQVLSKIYTLRSKIAHGSEADFKDRKLKELRSKEHVHQFLNLLVKRVIYFAISEPRLMIDLKTC